MVEDETFDHEPIRRTISLIDIYQRLNVAILEPTNFNEAYKSLEWREAMMEEIQMIKKTKPGHWWTSLTTRIC